MDEKSWRRNHVEGVLGGIWKQSDPGGTQEVPRRCAGTPRRQPGDPQEVPRGTQKAPRDTQEAARGPEGSLMKNVLKPLSFTAKTERATSFA